MRLQDEYGKFETIEGMNEYDVAVHYGIYKHGLLLREFYQLPLQKDLKVKEASRRIKKEEKEKKH